jgi:two-component sensor histidine kinase/PAS domain-containing protein
MAIANWRACLLDIAGFNCGDMMAAEVTRPWSLSSGRGVTPHLVALLLVAGVTLGGAWLSGFVPHLHPFSLFFPAVLAAALLGGSASGVTALASSALLGWRFFIAPGDPLIDLRSFVAVAVYVLAGALMVVAGARLRSLLAQSRAANSRLAERELRYRALFDAVSEGFALVEPIRDADGRLVDYVVLEANPAILRMLNHDADIIGKRQSEIIADPSPAWIAACDAAMRGEAIKFEFEAPATRRWFEIHLSRVSDNRLGQFVLDVTDRKLAEARQSELFDELNHRVKNNLSMVSAMLAMQARMTDAPQVREHLARAVDRIQTIADVHASLYRSSRKDDVDFAAYLHDLCTRLAGALLDGDRVRLEVAADPAVLPLDKAVALGVVVNEMVTNAAKYAYAAPASGIIKVALRRTPRGLTLSVSDTGVGLPASGAAQGLGMRLVRSLVQQIGGALEIADGPGAAFVIAVPDSAIPAP